MTREQEIKWLKAHLTSLNCALNLHSGERIVPLTRDVVVKGKLLCEARLQDLGCRDDAKNISDSSQKAALLTKAIFDSI